MPTPIHTHKVSHVVLYVADLDRSTKFWTEILGFKVSDVNEEQGMVFLRNANDHHTIGLFQGPKDGDLAPSDKFLTFGHVALEVDSIDDLFKAREFLKEQEIDLVFEGRRRWGCNVSLEFHDPDGYMVELTCQMDQVGWDEKTRPASMFRPVKGLEEVLATPLPSLEEVGAPA